jgi:hypothetical protein
MNNMKRKMAGHKYEVSLIAAAVGFSATAAAVATVGAGIMAAGSVLGIKEAKPIGGLMMAGGGIASGLGGLGMVGGVAGATSALGTLSAGASLVGGALQGAGILTGNDKLAGIGGLINGAGMIGSSMSNAPTGGASQGGASGGSASAGADPNWNPDYGLSTASNAPSSGVGGIKVAGANASIPAAAVPSGTPSLIDRIGKYDNYIKMAGDFATGMANSKSENDKLAQQNAQFQQEIELLNRRSTAVAIPGALPVSPGSPQAVSPITPNRSTGLLNTTSQQVPGVA